MATEVNDQSQITKIQTLVQSYDQLRSVVRSFKVLSFCADRQTDIRDILYCIY